MKLVKVYTKENPEGIELTWYEYHFFDKSLLHREDGPAVICFYAADIILSEEYYLNGVLHREDGPARKQYDLDDSVVYESYWLNGKKLTENNSFCLKKFKFLEKWHIREYE